MSAAAAGRLIIVTGPPGAGKSTVAARLAAESAAPRAVHLHTDDFYRYIRKGHVAPWLPEARDQNAAVMDALVAAATAYAGGGFEAVVDGIVGPWFLRPWRDAARGRRLTLDYVVLRPVEATAVARATSREGQALTDPEPVRRMWRQFAQLGELETHVLDTTTQDAHETVGLVRAGLSDRRFVLEPDA